MDALVLAAVLASALLHATWNASIKSRGDASGALTTMIVANALPHGVLLAIYGVPPSTAWPWIAGTVAASLVSLTLLASAYREGDFAVAYPLIRALIPVVLVLAALPLFGEAPSAASMAGVALVSCGLALIGWESARRSHTMTVRGLIFAAIAAVMTAASVLCDAKGARLSPQPLSYVATISLSNSLGMAALRLRKPGMLAMLRANWRIAIFALLVSNASYLLYIWAVRRAPVARVAAVRETSMIFAVLIAVFVLRERIGAWRLVAITVMAAGVVLIRL